MEKEILMEESTCKEMIKGTMGGREIKDIPCHGEYRYIGEIATEVGYGALFQCKNCKTIIID